MTPTSRRTPPTASPSCSPEPSDPRCRSLGHAVRRLRPARGGVEQTVLGAEQLGSGAGLGPGGRHRPGSRPGARIRQAATPYAAAPATTPLPAPDGRIAVADTASGVIDTVNPDGTALVQVTTPEQGLRHPGRRGRPTARTWWSPPSAPTMSCASTWWPPTARTGTCWCPTTPASRTSAPGLPGRAVGVLRPLPARSSRRLCDRRGAHGRHRATQGHGLLTTMGRRERVLLRDLPGRLPARLRRRGTGRDRRPGLRQRHRRSERAARDRARAGGHAHRLDLGRQVRAGDQRLAARRERDLRRPRSWRHSGAGRGHDVPALGVLPGPVPQRLVADLPRRGRHAATQATTCSSRPPTGRGSSSSTSGATSRTTRSGEPLPSCPRRPPRRSRSGLRVVPRREIRQVRSLLPSGLRDVLLAPDKFGDSPANARPAPSLTSWSSS